MAEEENQEQQEATLLPAERIDSILRVLQALLPRNEEGGTAYAYNLIIAHKEENTGNLRYGMFSNLTNEVRDDLLKTIVKTKQNDQSEVRDQ